jgi:hypothetical protein
MARAEIRLLNLPTSTQSIYENDLEAIHHDQPDYIGIAFRSDAKFARHEVL